MKSKGVKYDDLISHTIGLPLKIQHRESFVSKYCRTTVAQCRGVPSCQMSADGGQSSILGIA